jgi:hypothetical protein
MQAEEPTVVQSPSLELSPHVQRYGPTVLKVVWISIGLGIGMEVLLLLTAAAFGSAQSVKPFIAELTQKITWSFIVCVGLAIGRLASKAHVTLAGLVGLISAPLGFEVARAVHRGAAQALDLTVAGPAGIVLVAIVLVKTIEYGLLGLAIAWSASRRRFGVPGHVGLGLLFGFVFGGASLALTSGGGPVSPAVLAAWVINELLFPVGCALVLYATAVLTPPPRRDQEVPVAPSAPLEGDSPSRATIDTGAGGETGGSRDRLRDVT